MPLLGGPDKSTSPCTTAPARAAGAVEVGEGLTLLRSAANRGGLRFLFRLSYYPIKRSGSQDASAHHAQSADGISRIRATEPVAAVVVALEHHARSVAGSQESLAVGSDRANLFRREAIHHVLPGCTPIGAVEAAFTGSQENVRVRSNGHTVDAAD